MSRVAPLMFDLRGRTAVVTGAGSGIGAAVAKALYGQGASVVALARSAEALEKVAKELDPLLARVLCVAADVRVEAALVEARVKTVEKFGRVDILVTCAAAPAAAGPTAALSLNAWREVLETDLDGVFLSCKVFGAHMLERGYGRIVNLSSFHTVATYPERVAYNAAKSGVEGLTRALAVEWGRHGVTVNAVAPGPVRTPRTAWFLGRDPEAERGMLNRTPSARLADPGDVASLVAFLVSDEARHINGQQVVLDGGWTKSAWWGRYAEMGK